MTLHIPEGWFYVWIMLRPAAVTLHMPEGWFYVRALREVTEMVRSIEGGVCLGVVFFAGGAVA